MNWQHSFGINLINAKGRIVRGPRGQPPTDCHSAYRSVGLGGGVDKLELINVSMSEHIQSDYMLVSI